MNPKSKFTKSCTDYQEKYRESARRIDGEKIQCVLHILPGKKTNDIVLKIDEWIRQGQGEDGQNLTPESSVAILAQELSRSK